MHEYVKDHKGYQEDCLLALTFWRLACTPALRSSNAETVCSHDKHASVIETPYLRLGSNTDMVRLTSDGCRASVENNSPRRTFGGNTLLSFIDVGFNHNPKDVLSGLLALQLFSLSWSMSKHIAMLTGSTILTTLFATSNCFWCCFELFPCEQSIYSISPNDWLNDHPKNISRDSPSV
jgi:hypothetical protein